MGLELETVRIAVEKQIGAGPDRRVVGNIPYTPRVKKVRALAAKEAQALKHTYLGTEHILLGLLREDDGIAARVLKELGLEINVVRQYVLKELDPNYRSTTSDLATALKGDFDKQLSAVTSERNALNARLVAIQIDQGVIAAASPVTRCNAFVTPQMSI